MFVFITLQGPEVHCRLVYYVDHMANSASGPKKRFLAADGVILSYLISYLTKSYIDQACSLGMAAYSGTVLGCMIMEDRYMNIQKKNLASVWPYSMTKLVQRAKNF